MAELSAYSNALPQSFAEIERIARRALREDFSTCQGLRPLAVRVVSSFTTSYLLPFLALMLVRRGFAPVIEEAPFGTLVPELMAAEPKGCDLIIALPTHRDLQFRPRLGCSAAEADASAAQEVNFWRGLLGRATKPLIFLSFDAPLFRVLGELDGFLPGGMLRHVRQTNRDLAAAIPPSVSLIDAEALQVRIGLEHWHDERLYNVSKQPCAMAALPELADTIAAAAAARFGRARKVLVLDLDNTLWGGEVGDFGSDGIEIGAGSPDGEAFATFQAYAKALAARGVILAVCSKNLEPNARAPFRDNPNMILRETDIACFVANFEDKATNLRRIAKTLNVGLDSFVFVDDNPVERALIARECPKVLVIDLPDEPSLYPVALEAAKAFPLAMLTPEDMERNHSYQVVTQIAEARDQATDLDSYLASLHPKAVVEDISAASVGRIVQLIGKTNQFKLNPTSFTEAEIFAKAPSVIALRLQDRMQDYGIVAVAVTDLCGRRLVIENWVMSCRVFSRRLEFLTLGLVIDLAKRFGATEIAAPYLASAKNMIVPGVLDGMGFRASDRDSPYVLDLAGQAALPDHFMTITDKRAPHG